MKRIYRIIILLLLFSCSQSEESPEKIHDSVNFLELADNSILNLYDAFGDEKEGLIKDFGFSCIVKYKGKTILFDAGTNADIFKQNIEALKIDLSKIDFAIASHAHFDHINGFDYLLEVNPNVKIYFPFDLFWGANIPFDISGQEPLIADSLEDKMQYFNGEFDSFKFSQSGRFWNANIEFIKSSTEILPGIKLILTSSPFMGYFSKYPKVAISSSEGLIDDNETGKAKLVELNEISLSLDHGEGEVVIVGCSHSTIEKIISDAKLFTQRNIHMAYGGYHLLPYDRSVLNDLSVKLRDELKVNKVAPAHCTGHLAFKILQNYYGDNYIYAGLGELVRF